MLAQEEELLPRSLLSEICFESSNFPSNDEEILPNFLSQENDYYQAAIKSSTVDNTSRTNDDLLFHIEAISSPVLNTRMDKIQAQWGLGEYLMRCQFNNPSAFEQNFIKNLCSPKGSSILQKRLHEIRNEEVECVLIFLSRYLVKLIVNPCANYFCTDLFKKCNAEQRLFIWKKIFKDFMQLSLNYFGAHPIQALIELSSSNEENLIILAALSNSKLVLQLCTDKIGNNVIQKVLSHVDETKRDFINCTIIANFQKLVANSSGIAVVKTFIGNSFSNLNRQKIIECLNCNFLEICKNEYGNFAIQYILEVSISYFFFTLKAWGIENFLKAFNKIISKNIIRLCTNRCSSHVVEKLIDMNLNMNLNMNIITSIISHEKAYQLLDCKYGIYIFQKILKNFSEYEKALLKADLMKKMIIEGDQVSMMDRVFKLNWIVYKCYGE